MNRVVITGIGVASPLGIILNDVWSKLILGQSAVIRLSELYNNFPCRIASQIDNDNFNEIKLSSSSNENKTMSRSSILMMKAATEAMSCAGLSYLSDVNLEKCGVSIGIGFDSVDNSIEACKFSYGDLPYSAVGPFALTRALGNMPSAHLSVRYKFKGPSRSVNTACAAGLLAIGDAYRAVRNGEANVMIGGGVESSISPWSIAAFSRIRALPTKYNDKPMIASRPFDVNRSGFVMAEGAGAVVMESLTHAINRGRMPLAEIIGFGQSCDANNLVAPDSGGDGAFRAMKSALQSANIAPQQVSYVNAHATSTPLGDLVECSAIERLFGNNTLVSSFKGQLGHCLGGSGAVETVLSIKCILEGLIPPNGNLENPDPNIKVLLAPGGKKPLLWKDKQKIMVKNAFGFGGTNCSVVIKSFDNSEFTSTKAELS